MTREEKIQELTTNAPFADGYFDNMNDEAVNAVYRFHKTMEHADDKTEERSQFSKMREVLGAHCAKTKRCADCAIRTACESKDSLCFDNASDDEIGKLYMAYMGAFFPHWGENTNSTQKAVYDPVERPQHYASTSIECIDAMIETQGKEAVIYFCICNAFKYLWRHHQKNGAEDIKKASWYLNKAVELMNMVEEPCPF